MRGRDGQRGQAVAWDRRAFLRALGTGAAGVSVGGLGFALGCAGDDGDGAAGGSGAEASDPLLPSAARSAVASGSSTTCTLPSGCSMR